MLFKIDTIDSNFDKKKSKKKLFDIKLNNK